MMLVDNNIPEPAKEFEVELLNSGGGAEVGLGGKATIHIQHSDFAHGLFMFDQQSLRVVSSEPDNLNTEMPMAEFKVVMVIHCKMVCLT